jgi:hypothetical protein
MPINGYEIRIKGVVGESVRGAFPDMTVATKPAETVVYGKVADAAALRGLLDRIQELGLEVVELRRLPDLGPSAAPGNRHD